MRIHLISSRTTLEKDIGTLRRIVGILHKNGHCLASDWIEVAYQRFLDKEKPKHWPTIHHANVERVTQSDAVIAEATYENFSVGYQVAIAIQQKKPVLLIRRESADKNAFATGVSDDWVSKCEYNDESLEKIIEKFLDSHDIKQKDMRFNFFIDRKIHNYLRYESFKTGKTKAEVVRELLKKDIKGADKI